jgi:UDP-N-acetylmuramate--alanine ligase
MPTVVIAAGGTAGHVVPALAVADELRDRGARVVWAGTPGRAEAELVPQAGYEIEWFPLAGIDRRNPVRAATALARAAGALPAARAFLHRVGAGVVLGGGGYVAGPVGLAAALDRTPLVLTEADSRLGLANRVLARRARRVCLAFPIEGREGPRYLVTGRPVPRAVLSADRGAARDRLGLEEGEPCLLVFGGSLGARSLNLAAVEAFAGREDLAVLHIAGRRDFPELASMLAGRGAPRGYRLVEYVETLAEPLAAADLVLARAGGSIAEIAAAGKPAVLVPYPHATADHQTSNARWMADAGAAVEIADSEVTPHRLRAEVEALMHDQGRLEAMAEAARQVARPDAASRVADEVLEAAGEVDAKPSKRPASGPWSGRRLHFMGIGGAGMSGLALVAKQLGAEVSGCDRAESPYLAELRAAGIEPTIGHDPAHVEPGMEVVASTAVDQSEPELRAARELGATVSRRGPLLAEIAGLRRVIAVAGAHGKTTTTAMVAAALGGCGLDPGYLIGAELKLAGGERAPNARWTESAWIVVEADESDRSFLALTPEIAIVTSVELDHHATYVSELELEAAFEAFLDRLPEDGVAVLHEKVALAVPGGRRLVRFGLGEGATVGARSIEPTDCGQRFELLREGEPVCSVELPVPGEHNVLNALGALAAAEASGCALEEGAAALAHFRPAARRFELVGRRDGALVFDDYAHHPTEVEATLRAARGLDPARLVAAFQPHLYSRTHHLYREFGRALALADVVVVLDVYAARERAEGKLAGVTGKLVADAATDHAGGRPVWWLPRLEDAEKMLARHLASGDLLVTVGAGDVDRLARALVEAP